MQISKLNDAIKHAILSQNTTTASANLESRKESEENQNAISNATSGQDNVNIGLSKYINETLSKEAILSEREAKIQKLKELYEKGEYKGPEAKELARSFVEGIQEEVRQAANFFMLEDDI